MVFIQALLLSTEIGIWRVGVVLFLTKPGKSFQASYTDKIKKGVGQGEGGGVCSFLRKTYNLGAIKAKADKFAYRKINNSA